MKVFVQGRGEVSLGQGDYLASGGFGDVYAKGDIAYKIYQDPNNMIPVQKIDELSVLGDPNIIRPLEVLLDPRKHTPIGYTMRYLKDTYSLCQLFPKAFRDRTGLTPEQTLKLVQVLQGQVKHCHSKGVVMVDLNEMNELVSKNFSELYTIDVDNFKTRSFPAQGLMDSVKDWHANGHYDEKSDWFSFAVVVFNLFFGIHPYKGKHPQYNLIERMKHNVTVRDPAVHYPRGSVLPFDVAPEVYLRWLDAVLTGGQRLAPPEDLTAKIVLVTKLQQVVGSNNLEFTKLQEFAEKLVAYYYGMQHQVAVTSEAIYLGSTRVMDVSPGTVVVTTPKLGVPIAVRIDHGSLKLMNIISKLPIAINLITSQMAICDGRIVALSSGSFVEIEFLEIGGNIMATPKLVGNALERATTFYDGVAIQNLMGTWYADIFPGHGRHHIFKILESGWRVMDARYRSGVLQVVAVNTAGKYSRFVFRFADDFSASDVREVPDIIPSGLNFIVRDNGVVVQINEQSEIELFSGWMGSPDIKTIIDPAVSADMRLSMRGASVVFTRGNELYSMRMR